MKLADIDVAILAGGLGTRVQHVLAGKPKILAPVDGRAFLDHLLDWLERQGVRRVVMCLGYRAEDVETYLAAHPRASVEIRTAAEKEPLGTGGALAFAMSLFRPGPIIAMNGDTIVDVDLAAFTAQHDVAGAGASIVCAEVESAGRFGRLEIDSRGRITRFVEKDPAFAGSAWINAGIYLFDDAVLRRIEALAKGSLERDILEKLPPGEIYAFQAHGRFLDIGTPETLALASEVLRT